jgi:hypothetical protein
MKFFSNSTANTFTRSAAVNVLPDAMLAFGTGKPRIGAQKIFFQSYDGDFVAKGRTPLTNLS